MQTVKTFLMEVCDSIGSTSSAHLVQEDKARLLIEKGIDIDLQSDLSLATRKANKQLEGFGVVRGACNQWTDGSHVCSEGR